MCFLKTIITCRNFIETVSNAFKQTRIFTLDSLLILVKKKKKFCITAMNNIRKNINYYIFKEYLGFTCYAPPLPGQYTM